MPVLQTKSTALTCVSTHVGWCERVCVYTHVHVHTHCVCSWISCSFFEKEVLGTVILLHTHHFLPHPPFTLVFPFPFLLSWPWPFDNLCNCSSAPCAMYIYICICMSIYTYIYIRSCRAKLGFPPHSRVGPPCYTDFCWLHSSILVQVTPLSDNVFLSNLFSKNLEGTQKYFSSPSLNFGVEKTGNKTQNPARNILLENDPIKTGVEKKHRRTAADRHSWSSLERRVPWNSKSFLLTPDTCQIKFDTKNHTPSVCQTDSRTLKKLFGCGFSTPCTLFCLICTISFKLTYVSERFMTAVLISRRPFCHLAFDKVLFRKHFKASNLSRLHVCCMESHLLHASFANEGTHKRVSSRRELKPD